MAKHLKQLNSAHKYPSISMPRRTAMPKTLTPFPPHTLDTIADTLAHKGYIILKNIFSHKQLLQLQQRLQHLDESHWKPAGIGRHQNFQLQENIRSDHISWIDPTNDNPVERDYLNNMEILRSGLNQRLFMGLFDFECHFARYQKGSFYQKHIDTLKGSSNRVLSTILYLNTNWQKADSGELLIYPEKGEQVIERVLPEMGTQVIFLSEQFPHEVLPANRLRLSLTGWFRVS
jgi:SM-20-related protein